MAIRILRFHFLVKMRSNLTFNYLVLSEFLWLR
jgi:hypothetical protein